MKQKLVLFDADGMVINKKHLFSQVYTKEFGVPMNQMLKFFAGPFQPCLTGEADLKEILAPRLKSWNWPGSVDGLLEYWFTSENSVDDRVVASIKILRSKGIRCVMATNNEKYRTEYMKSVMGFSEIFDTVHSSCYLGYKKPDPAYYQKILELSGGLRPEEAFVWDDDPKNIEGARTAGIAAEAYTDFDSYQAKMESLLK